MLQQALSRGRNFIILFAAYALAVTLISSGCTSLVEGDPKELTRERAARLIKENDMFKSLNTIPFNGLDPVTPVEPEYRTEEEALARAIELFFFNHPQMLVLKHLGYIDVRASVVEKSIEKDRLMGPGFWKVRREVFLTEQGKAEARKYKGVDTSEIPVTQPEFVEVTGVTKMQPNLATAEFTWKEIPTTFGQAFDVSSSTYKSLPADLQQKLLMRRMGTRGITRDYTRPQQSQAMFQLYDDGWRLLSVR